MTISITILRDISFLQQNISICGTVTSTLLNVLYFNLTEY